MMQTCTERVAYCRGGKNEGYKITEIKGIKGIDVNYDSAIKYLAKSIHLVFLFPP